MAPSVLDIARLRRMTDEPTQSPYTDELLSSYLQSWPLIDATGKDSVDSGWIEAYDLHAASAEIWEEKAASLQPKHDFSADGASYSSNQMYENAMDQSRYHAARSKTKVKKVFKNPIEATSDTLYLGVVANEDPPFEDWDNLWREL